MAYKNDVQPQKGDAVLGVIDGEPARGTVLSVNDSKGTIIVQRYGPAIEHKSKQKIQGKLIESEVPSQDFELIYRKESK